MEWAWRHQILALFYYSTALLFGALLGLVRGTLSLNQPFRKSLVGREWVRKFLVENGIFSFLREEPVWYEVLRQRSKDELTFVQVRMKGQGGFYTGELKIFAIVDDSERDKDIYLVNVYYRGSEQDAYTPLGGNGVLLNFADIDAIQVIKETIQ